VSALDDFDALPPAQEETLIGDWDGELIATGHPGEPMLDGLRWAGKRFVSRDEVYPLICLDESGEREVNPVMGEATIRMVEYRGVVAATMVYDKHPIFDSFRMEDADTLVGAMDRKGDAAPLMFRLRRRAQA
jgi:hypothetical protein